MIFLIFASIILFFWLLTIHSLDRPLQELEIAVTLFSVGRIHNECLNFLTSLLPPNPLPKSGELTPLLLPVIGSHPSSTLRLRKTHPDRSLAVSLS
jgi:hypothetical protein